jgi:flavin-dependent dehydrogenase
VKSTIRNPKSKILIAGAGPAGAGLAIRLAKKKFDVCLVERERFPRQKLCGEFISPECFRHFRELGVFEEMFAAGGERISETIFYAPGGKFVNVPSRWFKGSEGGALSLSRAEMDFQLLKMAKSIGVEVLEETSIVGLLFNKENVCGVKIRTEDGGKKEIPADLFVDATGRARVLGKMISRRNAKAQSSKIQNPKSEIQNHLVGFKAHLKDVNLEKGACEIYFFNGGYGGLSYVENNQKF